MLFISINKINSQIKKAPTESQKQLIYALGCVYKQLGEEKNSKEQFMTLIKYGDENWNNTTQTLDDILSGNLPEIINGNIEEDVNIESKKDKIPNFIKYIILVLTVLSIIYTIYCTHYFTKGFWLFSTDNVLLNNLGFEGLFVGPDLIAKLTMIFRVILCILVFTIPIPLNYIFFLALGINILLMISFLAEEVELRYLQGGCFFIFIMILLNITEIIFYYTGLLKNL